MANSFVHLVGTSPWLYCWYRFSGDAVTLVEILFFGIFLDYFDHGPMKRLKRLLRGDASIPAGHINQLHAWPAFYVFSMLFPVFFAISPTINAILPLLAYWTHLGVDGPADYMAGHLPADIRPYFPEWALYKTGEPMIFIIIGIIGKKLSLGCERK